MGEEFCGFRLVRIIFFVVELESGDGTAKYLGLSQRHRIFVIN